MPERHDPVCRVDAVPRRETLAVYLKVVLVHSPTGAFRVNHDGPAYHHPDLRPLY